MYHKRSFVTIMCVIIIISFLCSTGIAAAGWEFFKYKITDLSIFYGGNSILENLSTEILCQVENEEYTLQINEMVITENELIINYAIHSEQFLAFEDEGLMAIPQICINGQDVKEKSVDSGASYSGGDGHASGIKLDEKTYQFIGQWTLRDISLSDPAEIEFTLNFLTVYDFNESEVSTLDMGDLSAVFSVPYDEDYSKGLQLELNQTVPIERGKSITLVSLYSSKLQTTIDIHTYDYISNRYCIKGHDDLGNELHFWMDGVQSYGTHDVFTNEGFNEYNSTFVLVDQKNIISKLGLDENARKLTLQFFYMTEEGEDYLSSEDDQWEPVGDEFIITLD